MKPKMRTWEIVALGRNDGLAAQLDRPTSDQASWRMQLSGRQWKLVFDVPGSEKVRDLATFVVEHANRAIFGQCELWKSHGTEVSVTKDPEDAGRFWIRVYASGQRTEIELSNEDAAAFQRALIELVSGIRS